MSSNSTESCDNKVKTLSTRLKRREEKIEHVLECIAEEAEKGTPIIVEGKKDVRTLAALGIKGNIISAKTGGKSRQDIILELENICREDVVLLLDFDRRGKELTEKLKQDLEKLGMRPNLVFWKQLLGLVGRDVKDIEGIAGYLDTLRRKIGEI